MTTKKNLVKTMFMNILTAGVFATAFTACNDDLNNEANGFNAPETESFELTNLEQYSYSVPVQVNAQGDWQIDLQFCDENHHFCYALPDHGHGPATVELCMLDNWTDTRNEAKMMIRDLSNSNNNKTFHLMQKCNLDNPNYTRAMTRAKTRGEGGEEKEAEQEAEQEIKNEGSITTAVGYGYNVNAEPGIKAISSNPIIALRKLEKSNEDYGPKFRKGEFTINVESYAASSIEEISSTMTASSTLKGSRGGFSAEADASFSNTQKSNSNNLFCLTIANVNIGQAVLQGIDRNNFREYMTDDAKRAIDGTGTAYPSTNRGFQELIRDFGSHLILRTDLGGRLRYGATIDQQYCSSTNELKAHASMSYKNNIIDGTAKVGNDYSSTYSQNKKHLQITVSAVGGGTEETAVVAANDTTPNVNSWIQSMKEEKNLAVINFNQKNSMQMWPLYELIDRSTPEGKARYDALKEYMESGQMEMDNCQEGSSSYVNNKVTRVDFPADWVAKADGKHSDISGTLIREARYDGKTVAWLCMEYIPQISSQGFVAVVYPVVDNKPNFQMGRFLGTATKQACKVEWGADGKCILKEYAEEDGMQKTVYLKANKMFNFQPSGKLVNTEEIRDMVLKGQKAKSTCNIIFGEGDWHYEGESYHRTVEFEYTNPWLKGLSYDNNYQYSLVKIGNQVWTRENYNGNVPHGSNQKERYGTKIDKGEVFFTFGSLGKASFPAGWHAGNAADYQGLRATITSDGVNTQFGERLQKGGVSGFELKWTGWYVFKHYKYDGVYYYNYEHKGDGTAAEFLLPGKGHIRIRADKFEVCANEKQDYWGMQIRLVMNL